MKIKYTNRDGSPTELKLSDKALTIGRSPDADIVVLDERTSRMHCAIRLWDGDYYLKDLQSRNGTYLNNEKVEMSKIQSGDRIRIGKTLLMVEDDNVSPGQDTLFQGVEKEMGDGKGYDTILKEIVDDVNQKKIEKEALPPEVKPAQRKTPMTMIKRKEPEEQASPKLTSAENKKPETPTIKIEFDSIAEEVEKTAPPTPSSDRGEKKPLKVKPLTRRPTQIKIKRPSK